ncbi:MAG TPA: alanine racemase [Candidatus Saccharimonadales bacterium]|nr:alanine racemase [Candidatus Saccharimonadales bacterium]
MTPVRSRQAPRVIGDLDTPVPLVDVNRLEANLAGMAAIAAGSVSARLRPHTKTHKTREVAQRQLAHGAAGLTVAKIGEAEAMIDAGFDDLYIAYPLVGDAKYERLLPLLDRSRIRFDVDSIPAADSASAFFARHGRVVDVCLEMDSAGRSGLVDIDEAIAVAARIGELPGLRLVGVMNYGNAYGTSDPAEQAAIGRREGEFAVEVADLLRRAGHDISVVTVGSTPTARHAARVDGVTELRPGVYALLDLKQVSLGPWSLDQCALTVLATVVSHARPDRYILDAGLKAMAGENYEWGTYGRILDQPEIVVTRATEEHGIVLLPDGVADPGWRIGERVRVIPDHACGTVNMHEELVAVDGERVVDRWRVIGRGRVR